MLIADLDALSALNSLVFIVDVVDLKLYELNLGMLRQNLIEIISSVVVAHSEMSDVSIILELEYLCKCIALGEVIIVALVYRVNEIEVEILNTACLKLRHEKRSDIILCLEIITCKLVG